MTRVNLRQEDFWIRWGNNSDFESIILDDYYLAGIGMANRKFKDSYIRRVSFSDMDLKDTTWIDCDMQVVEFRRCDLTNARFLNVKADQVEFVECKLEGAVFQENSFSELYMAGCDGRISFHSQAQGGKIMDCDFERSSFDYADFTQTYFWGCILDASGFLKATLDDSSYINCSITDCEFYSAASLKGADFSEAIIHPAQPNALRTTQHWVKVEQAPVTRAAVLICSDESQLVCL